MDWGSELQNLLHSSAFYDTKSTFIESRPISTTKFIVTRLLGLCGVSLFLILIVRKIVENIVKFKKGNSWLDTLAGPKPLWLIGNAHQLWSLKNRLKTWELWCQKYGPCFTFRVGAEKIIVLNTVEHIQKLLSSGDNAYLQKSSAYKIFRPFLGDGLINSRAQKWKPRRKLLTKAFTMQAFQGYMNVYNKESRILLAQLQKLFPERSDDNGELTRAKPVNGLLWNAGLRTVCETVMGIDILEVEGGNKMAETLETCKKLCMMRLLQPWLLNEWIWWLHPQSKLLNSGAKLLVEFTMKVINIHKKQTEMESNADEIQKVTDQDSSFILGKKPFRSMIEEMMSAGIDEDGIIEEVRTMISAGYETTATTMQFLMFLLALNPHHQKMCQVEVDEVFYDDSLCPGGDFRYESLSSLKYLERCIFETLRLFPVTFLFMRTLEKSLKLDDRLNLPTNSTVAIFIPGVHRNPEYYPDPNTFNPDRFLPEVVKERSQYAYIPFSAGQRNCIGFKFGILELKVTAARILQKFTIRTTDNMENVLIMSDIVLNPERPYNFILERRPRP